MAAPAPLASILPAVVGDLVHLPGFLACYVGVDVCTVPATSYACLSCRQLLANECQLTFHTERGVHVITRRCPVHGWEPYPC